MTRQNRAMFERAMQMFQPFGPKPSEDICELKSEIEAMRKQLAEPAQVAQKRPPW